MRVAIDTNILAYAEGVAKSAKKGLFELAEGGTIFLDEVGDMPTGLQAKLLRFLEDRTFRRVGGTNEIKVDVRVIAATNRDIDKAVEEGKFRSDLLFRLNVIPIELPPLRERGDDVSLLARFYITHFAKEFRKPITKIDDEVLAQLAHYAWPGNVRELRNVIERAVLLSQGDTIGPLDIVVGQTGRGEPLTGTTITLSPGGIDLHKLENSLVLQALTRTNNNQTHAARLLGLSRDALRYRMEKLGLLKTHSE